MSTTQRPARRRSARLAFGNEDAQLQDRENGVQTSKRMKKDEGHSIGRNAANGDGSRAVKKRNVSYDEEDDGFMFTRTRSKKTKVAQAVPEPVPEEVEMAPTNSKSKKVNPEPKPPEKEMFKSRRRSARVAGAIVSEKPRESGNDEKQEGDVNTVKATVKSRKEDVKKVDEPVVATAQDTTKIALPLSDSPVMKRNKEFRQHGSKGHRRSSTGLRGRRASSLIDSGSDALPHREVGITEFYKHIAGEGLSEPRRMKQLLTWCGTRALEDNPLHASDEDSGTLAAQIILKELLKDFSQRSEMSDWFSREETAPKTVIKKPNPRNIANAAKVEELEKQVRGLREERSNWKTFFAAAPPTTSTAFESASGPATTTSPTAPLQPSDNPSILPLSEINATLFSDPQQTTILTKLITDTNPTTITSLAQTTLQSFSSNLELTIDRFADGVHKVGAYQTTADRVADTMLGILARRLEEKDRSVRERAGTRDLKLGEVLRSLGRLEGRR